MKKYFALLVTILFVILSTSAFAVEKNVPVSTRSDRKVGFGLATATNLTGNSTALSGWFDIDANNGIQPLFTIPSSDPFQISFAMIYKHTVLESGGGGLHLGGGVGIGSIQKDFALGLSALGGIHFSIPGASQIKMHFDGGPTFMVQNSKSQFKVEALSPTLGASILYLF